jgi:hypothetical protein
MPRQSLSEIYVKTYRVCIILQQNDPIHSQRRNAIHQIAFASILIIFVLPLEFQPLMVRLAAIVPPPLLLLLLVPAEAGP